MSIFTEDYPDVGIDRALRLGYKLPFKTIMPSYIKNTKFFSDLFDAIDEVFDKHVYNQIFLLKNIRNMWLSNPQLEQKIMDAKELISLEDWTLPSNEVVVKQLNTLGLQLGKSASLFNNKDYLAFCRFIGQYWYEKGTGTFMDFVNFCCGADYTFVNAWTKDYSKFYKEGDSAIGTPIWEGGEWYPTTHVRFVSKNNYNADVHIIAVLFNEIANYNLVLASIEQEFSFGPEPGSEGGEGGSGGSSQLPDDPQSNGYICFGITLIFREAIKLGFREVLDINRNILGLEGQHLGQLDHVPFAEEIREYEDQEVFGFNTDQNNFNAPFA